MKKLLTLLVVLLMSISLIACGETPANNTGNEEKPNQENKPGEETGNGETIKIGMLASLTGNYATQGEYAVKSAQVAIEEINGNGGVLGKNIEVVVEDDMGTDEGAINAYEKLAANKDIVAIIGSGYSTLNLAVNDSVSKAQILTTAQGSNDKLGQLNNEWHYQVRTPDIVQVTAGIRYAVEELGLKSWAVINATDAASVGQAETTINTLKEYNIEPALHLQYNEGTQDFTSQLVQVNQADIEALFLAGNAVEGALLMTQIRQMNLPQVIVGSNAYSSAQMLELAEEGVLDGVYSATHYTPETPREVGKKYTEAYRALTGIEPDAAGALVYDHVRIIVEAIKNADSADRTALKDAFKQIKDFDGAVTDYTIKSEGGAGTSAMIVQNEGLDKKVIDIISLEGNK